MITNLQTIISRTFIQSYKVHIYIYNNVSVRRGIHVINASACQNETLQTETNVAYIHLACFISQYTGNIHRERVLFLVSSLSCLQQGSCLIQVICVCCAQWCSTHIVLCFCFVFLRIVYPMLPVSLYCTFLIVPSVFSNVYLRNRSWKPYCVVSFNIG